MDRYTQELARAKQQELAREDKDRIWAHELRGERRKDGTLRFFRLPRR